MRQKMTLSQKELYLELSRHHHKSKESEVKIGLHEKNRIEDEQKAGVDEVVDEHENDSDDS